MSQDETLGIHGVLGQNANRHSHSPQKQAGNDISPPLELMTTRSPQFNHPAA